MTGGLPMLTGGNLSGVDGVRHGFFTREGGVSDGIYASLNMGYGSGDEADLVSQNRDRAMGCIGLGSGDLVTLYQVHSPDCVEVADTGWMIAGPAPRADAMVTDKPGIALGVCTADCAPVLFADSAGRVAAAAHAGWKGALTGVLEATIDKMTGLGAARSDIVAAIGPCIGQASYEVGPEFRERFVAEAAGNERFFIASSRAEHYRFDLEGFIHHRLERAGIGGIDCLSLDTCSEENRFFSYRRSVKRVEPDYGRQISAIALTRQEVRL